MTFTAHVRHVVAKDVRESWPLLAGYCAVVGVTALAAVMPINPPFESAWMMDLFVFLLSVLVMAALVQTDSPVSPRPWWTIVPVPVQCLVGAKILEGLFLLAFSLVVTITMIATRADFAVAVSLVEHGPLAQLVLYLAVGLALGASTTRLGASFAVIVAYFIAVVILPTASGPRDVLSTRAYLVASSVALLGAVILLSAAYRYRDWRRILAFGIVGAVGLQYWPLLARLVPTNSRWNATPVAGALLADSNSILLGNGLDVSIRPPVAGVWLLKPIGRAAVFFDDGTTDSVTMAADDSALTLAGPAIRYRVGDTIGPRLVRVSSPLSLPPMASTITRIHFRVVATRYSYEKSDTLPLNVGARRRVAAGSVRVDGFTPRDRDRPAAVEIASDVFGNSGAYGTGLGDGPVTGDDTLALDFVEDNGASICPAVLMRRSMAALPVVVVGAARVRAQLSLAPCNADRPDLIPTTWMNRSLLVYTVWRRAPGLIFDVDVPTSLRFRSGRAK